MSIFSSKNLAVLAVMVVAIVALDRGITFAGKTAIGQSKFRYAQLYTNQLDHDVAVLGNSRGVHSFFAPDLSDQLCRDVVNLSFNGISPRVIGVLGQDAIERMPNLKVAILEVSNVFVTDGIDAQLSPFTLWSPRLSDHLDKERPGFLPWTDVFQSLALNSELFFRALFYIGRSDQGWINTGPHITATAQDAYMQTGRDLTVVPTGLDALVKNVAALQAADVTPILVAAPYHDIVRKAGTLQADWVEVVSDATGLPVLDLTWAVSGDTGFNDPLHLNRVGSAAVTQALAQTQLSNCETVNNG